MNKYRGVLLFISAILFLSCEKNCERQRNTRDTVDVHTLRPVGKFKADDIDQSSVFTISSDSTAVLTYTANDTTYEISYKIQTKGTMINNQKKWNLK